MPGNKKKVTRTKKGKGAPPTKSGSRKKDWRSQHQHLFPSTPKAFGIGGDVVPKKRDLSRYVKWPRYVRLQRQRAILKKRLKVPPGVHQFTNTLDRNQAHTLFRILAAHRPESAQEKSQRLKEQAGKEEKGQEDKSKKPRVVKFGLNHVTDLIESRKAKLVVIAHDVDPLELVIFLPALCRRMDIPYVIVKGKARLGQVVYQKTATVLALTDVKKESAAALDQFIKNVNPQFIGAPVSRKFGGGVLGVKAQAVVRAREREAAKEAAKAQLF
eukprot:CAMPEP_0183350940 /NCGR_PEP_ID=MMETSP0164_2-20130417/22152_1 /TAXON_ID=221442 /ORGANISM="Coccolithus pelagicus ssp braarudi, Strain PLY182g" /LENGTH=270 /DNA_ID=CAMNT_0025522983 /DNA_START=34 /DNA_END=846 /DNA_ORIENTATION=+